MSSIINDSAIESMFDAELTTAKLLEAVKANVANTVKTVDAAASLENKLSEEAAQFNACLTTMSNSIRKCERGEISREEMLAECAPCVSALKEKCVALKLADVKTTGDDITEDEIAMLKEYIVGCKDIVADRKAELQDAPVEGATESGILGVLADFEPATEASMIKEIRKSTEAKTAAQLYKQAKKLYGLGSKEQALTYLKKAQKLYEGCLKKAEEAGKMYEVEREAKAGQLKDTYKKEVTDNISAAMLIQYFEDRVDACKALEMQWNNKAGKSTYKETKAQLKAERKEARAAKKAAKKAEKEAAKATESYEEDVDMTDATEALGMSVEAFIVAMESEMDAIEMEISLDAATEAEGDEAEAPKAGGIFGRIRGGLSKLRKADTANERKEAADEAKAAAKELEEAADEATTPEEKKRLSKAAKGTLIALGTAAASVGLYAIAKKCKQNSEKSGQDPKAVAKLIYGAVDSIDKAAGKVKGGVAGAVKSAGDAAASRRVGKVEARQAKLEADQKRADDYFIAQAEKARQGKIAEINKSGTKYEKLKAKGKLGKGTESFLESLAFGLESVTVEGEDVDDDIIEPLEGKAFDDEDLAEVAAEAAIAVMMAEDGIDDSDLD